MTGVGDTKDHGAYFGVMVRDGRAATKGGRSEFPAPRCRGANAAPAARKADDATGGHAFRNPRDRTTGAARPPRTKRDGGRIASGRLWWEKKTNVGGWPSRVPDFGHVSSRHGPGRQGTTPPPPNLRKPDGRGLAKPRAGACKFRGSVPGGAGPAAGPSCRRGTKPVRGQFGIPGYMPPKAVAEMLRAGQ